MFSPFFCFFVFYIDNNHTVSNLRALLLRCGGADKDFCAKANLINKYMCWNWAGTHSWLQHTKHFAKQESPALTRMLKWQLLPKPLFGNYISVGLLYISAQISLAVTSVNNGNKERTCRRWCVPPRQSTCHRVARPVPVPQQPLSLSLSPLILLLAICRSTDQTALSHGEWWEWLMELVEIRTGSL